MQTVKVIPVQGGWMVESQVAAPTAFLSGAAAEKKAEELGRLLAARDQAQVLVHDRGGCLVGSTVMGDPRTAPETSARKAG
ncbi:MAG: hypothetical protein ACK41C_02670 [Phenylobacterium sp.]|uniref:hypothetical protein n=1 Tax=Phenylobacterium sp. TaxID=1871053 RepID=UPI00391AC82B